MFKQADVPQVDWCARQTGGDNGLAANCSGLVFDVNNGSSLVQINTENKIDSKTHSTTVGLHNN